MIYLTSTISKEDISSSFLKRDSSKSIDTTLLYELIISKNILNFDSIKFKKMKILNKRQLIKKIRLIKERTNLKIWGWLDRLYISFWICYPRREFIHLKHIVCTISCTTLKHIMNLDSSLISWEYCLNLFWKILRDSILMRYVTLYLCVIRTHIYSMIWKLILSGETFIILRSI